MKWTAGEAERECEGKDLGTGLSLIHNAPECHYQMARKTGAILGHPPLSVPIPPASRGRQDCVWRADPPSWRRPAFLV